MSDEQFCIVSCPPRHAMSTIHQGTAAAWSAINLLGGPECTMRDATRVFAGYADLTNAAGKVIAPGPLARPERWRQSFAFKLALAIRGVL